MPKIARYKRDALMNVRLTEKEIEGIVLAIKHYIKNKMATLYLYGSRTNIDKKGGDIDLLLLFNSVEDKLAIMEIKHYILSEIKNNIGDQKIDLLLASHSEINKDPFLKTIFSSAILLKSWN